MNFKWFFIIRGAALLFVCLATVYAWPIVLGDKMVNVMYFALATIALLGLYLFYREFNRLEETQATVKELVHPKTMTNGGSKIHEPVPEMSEEKIFEQLQKQSVEKYQELKPQPKLEPEIIVPANKAIALSDDRPITQVAEDMGRTLFKDALSKCTVEIEHLRFKLDKKTGGVKMVNFEYDIHTKQETKPAPVEPQPQPATPVPPKKETALHRPKVN